MAHIRQQIREAVADLLNASTAGLWRHVFETRINPTRDVSPYLLVFIDSESAENLGDLTRRSLDRRTTLNIDAYLRISDDEQLEDKADAIAVEIEELITYSALDSALGLKLQGLQLQQTSLTVQGDYTDRDEAILSLQYEIRVFSVEGDAESFL